MRAPWDIPQIWKWLEIKDLGDIVSGGTPSTKDISYWGNDVNWISPGDLTGYTKKTIVRGAKNLTHKGLAKSSARLMPAGSIHFSSRAPIGYVVISSEPLSTNQGFKSLVPAQGIFNEYVYYYLKAAKYIAEERASGTTFREISGAAFGKLPLPFSSLPEQRQIVSKIEELFSELDNGIESLKKAREQLKTYRQAVLKYAFEGKLTNQVENDELPKSWNIQRLGECLEIVSGNTPKGINNAQNSGKIPFYKVGDMNTPGNEVFMKKANLNLTQNEVSSLKVKLFPKGTVIFPKRGGAILTNKKRMLSSLSGFDLNLMGAIPNKNIDSLYLYYWFQKLNLSNIYDGSNVPQINRKNIAPLVMPIPQIGEQHQIVSKIETRLSVCDQLEKTIEDSLKKAEALRQSILKKAFNGELTREWRERNPELITGENSAEKLLERIKAEKARLAEDTKKRRSGRVEKK